MDRANITNVLLVVILWILLKQFYPATADTLLTVAIVVSVLYCCYWLVTQFPQQWKKRKLRDNKKLKTKGRTGNIDKT